MWKAHLFDGGRTSPELEVLGWKLSTVVGNRSAFLESWSGGDERSWKVATVNY